MSPGSHIKGSARLTAIFIAIVVVSTLLAAIAEELFSNRLFDIDEMPLISVLFLGVGAGALALLFFFMLYPKIGKLVQANADVVPISQIGTRSFLITGYSPVRRGMPFPDIEVLKQMTVDEACDSSDFKLLGSWQQNIRTIATLSGNAGLKEIYVINPDIDQFAAFENTISALFPDTISVTLVSDPDTPAQPYIRRTGRNQGENPGYEDFDHIQASIRRAVRMIAHNTGNQPDEVDNNIAIDITPGTKTYSMAAAIATLNSKMVATYITSFSGNPWELIPYDASIRVGDSPL